MNELGPQAGLVIHYSYLWHDEARRGQEEGVKDRPCVIFRTQKSPDDRLLVSVFPITHTPQDEASKAVAIPAKTRARLGLDAQPSWVVTTECNRFTWPGFDLRPLPGKEDRSPYAYGYLPKALFDMSRERFTDHALERRFRVVGRDEKKARDRNDEDREP